MAYEVRIADRAQRDLEAIYSYIQADHSDASFDWYLGMERAILSLKDFPERGSLISKGTPHRHLLYGPYRILYSVDPGEIVHVLHIRHGRRAGSGLR